jgi:hypothetical protein
MSRHPVAVEAGQDPTRLTVVGEGEPYFWRGRFSRTRWVCECDCGKASLVRDDRLKSGTTRSCGCLRAEKSRERMLRHGGRVAQKVTAEYSVWQRILHREADGAVCRRWRAKDGKGYFAFLADMGPRPSERHRLVRLDPRRAYSPANCQWLLDAPRRGTARRSITVRGRSMTLKDAASATGVEYGLLCKRLQRGWPPARALRP